MPVYNYNCRSCGSETERFLKLDHYQDTQYCDRCNGTLEKVIKPTMITTDYESYQCPRTGKTISGRKAHEENLKRVGCRVLESGEREEFIRDKAKEEAEFDRRIDATIDKQLESMPAQKMEVLAREISSGADVEVVRQ